MAIEIRLLRDDEIELANNLFNGVYGAQRPIENFRWEFLEGPAGKAIYVVATDDTQIVGIQCAIPLWMTSPDGTSVLTAKSEDTLVHPGYRGQKLFERMYELLFAECRKAGIKYIWGFTPALKAFERVGFEAPFSTSQALMVFKPRKAFRYFARLNPANRKNDLIRIRLLMLFSYFVRILRGRSAGDVPYFAKADIAPRQELINTIYNDTRLFFLRQDAAYTEWRLRRNPFRNRYLSFEGRIDKDVVSGYVLANLREDVAYIEEMVFARDTTALFRAGMLKKVIAELKAGGAPAIRVLCFENNDFMREQIGLLQAVGFTYLRRGNYFVWKSLDDKSTIDVRDIFFSRLFTQGNI